MAKDKLERVKPAEIVTAVQADGLREVENRVLQKTLSIVEDFLHFGDIPLGSEFIPEDWMERLGPEVAERRLRLATMAQLNQREAPVGIKYAKEVLIGIVKARATEKAEPRELNIAFTKIEYNLPKFPSRKVER